LTFEGQKFSTGIYIRIYPSKEVKLLGMSKEIFYANETTSVTVEVEYLVPRLAYNLQVLNYGRSRVTNLTPTRSLTLSPDLVFNETTLQVTIPVGLSPGHYSLNGTLAFTVIG